MSSHIVQTPETLEVQLRDFISRRRIQGIDLVQNAFCMKALVFLGLRMFLLTGPVNSQMGIAKNVHYTIFEILDLDRDMPGVVMYSKIRILLRESLKEIRGGGLANIDLFKLFGENHGWVPPFSDYVSTIEKLSDFLYLDLTESLDDEIDLYLKDPLDIANEIRQLVAKKLTHITYVLFHFFFSVVAPARSKPAKTIKSFLKQL